MKIETIPNANLTLSAPVGWGAEREGTDVLALPVLRHENSFVSQWRPSIEELEAMLNGAPIWLHVLGTGHPPVAVTVAPISIPEKDQPHA